MDTSLEIHIESRTRVFPETAVLRPTKTPLSILDSTVAGFSSTGAVWIYDRPIDIGHLTMSLRKTLDAYPQWAGQLHLSSFVAGGDHTQRQGRLAISYGTESDPGVAVIIARSGRTVSSVYPAVIDGCWEAGQVHSEELLDPPTRLALYNMADYEGLPGMVVQLTSFQCGGVAVAVKLAHSLADAQALLQFAHNWAAVNRALLSSDLLPILSPVFEPARLDRAAAGDIDAKNPDQGLLDTARALPLHRYDYWAPGSKEGCPSWSVKKTEIPDVIDPKTVGLLGTPIPWSQWDWSAPVDHYVVFFSATEVHAMWKEASSSGRVSHLDALLAHIWALVVRARGLEPYEQHHLDISIGIRSRLSPPLPESFVGSPLLNATATVTASQAHNNDVGAMASAIRSTLRLFNPDSVSSLLHEFAHEASSQRYWNCCLGRRNVIATSWLRLGVYDVTFDGQQLPRYALLLSSPAQVLMNFNQIRRSRHAQRGWLYSDHGSRYYAMFGNWKGCWE